MPLYEYTCSSCRQDFELLIRGSEQAECPRCGGSRLTKLMSVPAAPADGGSNLPMCEPRQPQGCGLPQCGGGQCAME